MLDLVKEVVAAVSYAYGFLCGYLQALVDVALGRPMKDPDDLENVGLFGIIKDFCKGVMK